MKWTFPMLLLLVVAVAGAQPSREPNDGFLCSALTMDFKETLAQMPRGPGEGVTLAKTLQRRLERLAALGVFLGCGSAAVPFPLSKKPLPPNATPAVETTLSRLLERVKANQNLSPPTPRTCHWLFVAFLSSEGDAKDAKENEKVAALHTRLSCPATTDTIGEFRDLEDWP